MNYCMLVLLLIFCPAHAFFLSCVRKTQEHIPLYDDSHLDSPTNLSQPILTLLSSSIPCEIVRTIPQTHHKFATWTLDVVENGQNCIEVKPATVMQPRELKEPLRYIWAITRKRPGMARLRTTYTSPFSPNPVVQEFMVKVS